MSFELIYDQDHVVAVLKKSMETNRLSHAYLFTGKRGIGKHFAAELFSKRLLCYYNTGCDSCSNCRKFDNGNHPNYRYIERDSSIKIDDIRQLKEESNLQHEKYRIWVIKDADKLTLQAANSFLKILEEPPLGNIFILLTNNVQKLLPTIISRCQVLNFQQLSENTIVKLMHEKISEKNDVDNNRVTLVARMAGGSIGCAMELWSSDLLNRRKTIIEKLVALPDASIPQILGWSYKWEEDRQQVIADIEIMYRWYRDLFCLKIQANVGLYNLDFERELVNACERYTLEALHHICKTINKMSETVNYNVRIRFIINYLLLQMKKGALL